MLKSRPVSWCSKKQSMMTLLSIKAKYIAIILAIKEVT